MLCIEYIKSKIEIRLFENLMKAHLSKLRKSFQSEHHFVNDSRSACSNKQSVMDVIHLKIFASSANKRHSDDLTAAGKSFMYSKKVLGPK